MTNLLKIIANALGFTKKEMEIRQTINELRSLSNRDLDDLGIARRNIEEIARSGSKNKGYYET
uniref:YjiS-like domain-containing protein n=1 Tax=uncultured Thiotrichaceae bacterium TaxID=298394 RepID=A0A6S6T5K2_9GAMM|nr:MAG: Unknown protein [uncultured Thiotrichaceae bacterium]